MYGACALRRSFLTVTVSISNLSITNSRQKPLLNIAPNSFPANRITVTRRHGDDSPIDFIQVRVDVCVMSKATDVLRSSGSGPTSILGASISPSTQRCRRPVL